MIQTIPVHLINTQIKLFSKDLILTLKYILTYMNLTYKKYY